MKCFAVDFSLIKLTASPCDGKHLKIAPRTPETCGEHVSHVGYMPGLRPMATA